MNANGFYTAEAYYVLLTIITVVIFVMLFLENVSADLSQSTGASTNWNFDDFYGSGSGLVVRKLTFLFWFSKKPKLNL